jgi:hypothetical protein
MGDHQSGENYGADENFFMTGTCHNALALDRRHYARPTSKSGHDLRESFTTPSTPVGVVA